METLIEKLRDDGLITNGMSGDVITLACAGGCDVTVDAVTFEALFAGAPTTAEGLRAHSVANNLGYVTTFDEWAERGLIT